MTFLKITSTTILALAILWGIGFGIFALNSLSKKPDNIEQKTDAIIVLTGGKNRIETGLQLFADGAAAHLFITGVNKDVTRAELLARWKSDIALPSCCITLGYEARSTVQNAQETREWLKKTGFKSIRMVTGNYHMNRAELELAHALPDIKIYTHPVSQDDLEVNHELLRNLLISEYHKTLYRGLSLIARPRDAVHQVQQVQ